MMKVHKLTKIENAVHRRVAGGGVSRATLLKMKATQQFESRPNSSNVRRAQRARGDFWRGRTLGKRVKEQECLEERSEELKGAYSKRRRSAGAPRRRRPRRDWRGEGSIRKPPMCRSKMSWHDVTAGCHSRMPQEDATAECNSKL